MLRKKRKFKSNIEKNSIFKSIKKNFIKISLITITCLMLFSIVGYFIEKPAIPNVNKYNERKIKEYNLEELYMQKNLEHNNVKIAIFNNTDEPVNGLAAKINDCLIKGYKKNNIKIRGDYTITKQANLNYKDQVEIGKKGIYFYPEKTEIIIHNKNSEFKPHIQEFLSFTGFGTNIVKYNYEQKLFDDRDITIILGNDWESSNLKYCQEIIN